MKRYLLIAFLLFGLVGCKSSSNKELILEMQEYVDVNGEACIKYVDADTTLVRTR